MDILVDYDNIRRTERNKGLLYLVDRIVNALGAMSLAAQSNVRLRLYGGWYEGQSLTRAAQQLSAGIQAHFPRVCRVSDGAGWLKLTASAELAYSLAVDPSRRLWHTFRPRGMPQGIRCNHPSAVGCTDPNCPLVTVHDFFASGKCPTPGCSLSIEDFIGKDEQKLVDTMLTADLIHLARSGPGSICVVTSE